MNIQKLSLNVGNLRFELILREWNKLVGNLVTEEWRLPALSLFHVEINLRRLVLFFANFVLMAMFGATSSSYLVAFLRKKI